MQLKNIAIGVNHTSESEYKLSDPCFIHFTTPENEDVIHILRYLYENVDANYYGVMNGKKYMCFNKYEKKRKDEILCELSKNKYGYAESIINDCVNGYAIIVYYPGDLKKIQFPGTEKHTLKNSTKYINDRRIPDSIFSTFDDIFKSSYKEFRLAFDMAMASTDSFHILDFVMDKTTFYSYCKILFDILERIKAEQVLFDGEHLEVKIACLLLAVFVKDITLKYPKKVKYLPIVKFKDSYSVGKEADDLAIFVSHRTDLNSATIPNPLYHNIRCGAVFDKTLSQKAGDDIGDNISGLSYLLGDFTVQYWAWKNYDASYYGICQYNNYLVFSNFFDEHKKNERIIEEWNNENLGKYGLLSRSQIALLVYKYDGIFEVFNSCNLLKLVPIEDIDYILTAIKEKYPCYYTSACKCLLSDTSYESDCFILKKELFFQLCEFQFDILFDFYKHIGCEDKRQALKCLGKVLCAVFFFWLEQEEKYKIETRTVVSFMTFTEKKACL